MTPEWKKHLLWHQPALDLFCLLWIAMVAPPPSEAVAPPPITTALTFISCLKSPLLGKKKKSSPYWAHSSIVVLIHFYHFLPSHQPPPPTPPHPFISTSNSVEFDRSIAKTAYQKAITVKLYRECKCLTSDRQGFARLSQDETNNYLA